MEWQKVIVLVGAALIFFGYAALAWERVPTVLAWMRSHGEYASMGMIVGAHGFSFGWCWICWRHWALGWPWSMALWGQ